MTNWWRSADLATARSYRLRVYRIDATISKWSPLEKKTSGVSGPRAAGGVRR